MGLRVCRGREGPQMGVQIRQSSEAQLAGGCRAQGCRGELGCPAGAEQNDHDCEHMGTTPGSTSKYVRVFDSNIKWNEISHKQRFPGLCTPSCWYRTSCSSESCLRISAKPWWLLGLCHLVLVPKSTALLSPPVLCSTSVVTSVNHRQGKQVFALLLSRPRSSRYPGSVGLGF